MAVTAKQIAEAAGVSRGTVDRVLNNRGKVSRETDELVRRIAEQMGYTPNPAARALAAQKKTALLALVVPSVGNPFFDEVLAGAREAADELSGYGMTLETYPLRGYDAERQAALIDSLAGRISALVLTPVDDPAVAAAVDRLADLGVPTVTLNSDLTSSRRALYVGPDYYRSGMLAAGMLSLSGAPSRVAIAAGSAHVLGHRQRLEGFRTALLRRAPACREVCCFETEDSDELAYSRALKALRESEPDAIFIAAAGVGGVCRAAGELGLSGRVKIVSFDDVPETAALVRSGVICATICQKPRTQGREAVRAVWRLYLGSPAQDDTVEISHVVKILESFL